MRPVVRLLCAVSVVAAGAPAVVLPVLSASPAMASGTSPEWTAPVKLDSGGAEPGVKIPPDGRSAAYVTAPGPSGSNFWKINEAVDSAGNTTLTPSVGVQPDMGTGGGDAEISVGNKVDPSTGCAPIAYSGLHNIDLLDNFTVATSTDCGKTFSLLNPYATQNTLTDRQWQTFDGVKTNHLLYHKVDSGQIVDSRSEDGGRTYLTLGTPTGANGVIDANHAFTLQNVKIGNVVTDYSRPIAGQTYPISGEPIHRLWATFEGSRDAADAAAAAAPVSTGPSFDHLDTVYVAHSDDGGLTWTDTAAYTTAATDTRELDLIFPVLSVDKAGNLYSAWTDGNLIQYVASTDGGATWTKPYTLTAGETGAAKTNGTANLFPWIEAAGNGRLDVVWYHGEGGDTSGYRSVGDANTKWTVAFAQLSNAAAGGAATPTPTVEQQSLAVSPVLHTGNVCNNGTTCGITSVGDRTLLDFFQVAVDGQGRANIVYADDQGSAGTSHVEYIRQNSGLSLINGAPITPNTFAVAGAGVTCTPDATITDPAGDATGAAVVSSTPAPSQDDLDILRAYLTTSAAGDALTTHINVKALGSTGGQYFRFYFSYGNAQYLTTASRSVSGATSYALSVNGTTGSTTLKTINGQFDPATNEVTATFTLDDFNSTAKPPTPLAAGSSLGGLQVLAQRSAGTGATLTADTATGACPYVVGTAALPVPSPSDTTSPSATPTATTSASPSPSPSSSATDTSAPSPTGTASPPAGVAGLYHPLTPQRILDTRTDNSGINAGADRQLLVTGAGGIPAHGVSAVVLGMVVPQPRAAGDLEVYPVGNKPSNRTSNLNWVAGKTVANLVTVQVGDGGKVGLSVNTGRADLAVDVLGWYGDASDSSGARYTALTPSRVLDTGTGSGRLYAGVDKQLKLRGAGGVPNRSDVTGVVLNLTALGTRQTADLQVYPTGARPARRTSNTNLLPGGTSAVLVNATLGSDGSIQLSLSRDSARVVVDVVGYFSSTGGRYVPMPPVRVVDRDVVQAGQDRTEMLAGSNGIPADATGVLVNVTGLGASKPLDLQVYPTGFPPARRTSVLNLLPGQNVPNLDAATLSGKSLSLSVSQGSAEVILDAVGYYTSR